MPEELIPVHVSHSSVALLRTLGPPESQVFPSYGVCHASSLFTLKNSPMRCPNSHRCATFCHHDLCHASSSSSSKSWLKAGSKKSILCGNHVWLTLPRHPAATPRSTIIATSKRTRLGSRFHCYQHGIERGARCLGASAQDSTRHVNPWKRYVHFH